MIFILKLIAFVVFLASKFGRKRAFKGFGYIAVATGLFSEAGDADLFGSKASLWTSALKQLWPILGVFIILTII